MDRLQKKCVVASTGVHLMLASVLVVGPAFVSSKPEEKLPDDMPVLDFVAIKTTDLPFSGGGDPTVKSAPPATPLPAPAPRTEEKPIPAPEPPKEKEKVQEPDPPKEKAKPTLPLDPDKGFEVSNKPQKKRIEISTKQVIRNPDSKSTAKDKEKARAEAQAKDAARQWAASRQQLARHFDESADVIGNGLSGGTSVKLQGPGGGGVPYANFLQAVKSVYARAWTVPDGVTDDNATTVATVTIARDGTVVSARITRSSGNAVVDRSVRATLDRVTFAAPLPDNAKEDERTVSINFNVKAKRLLG